MYISRLVSIELASAPNFISVLPHSLLLRSAHFLTKKKENSRTTITSDYYIFSAPTHKTTETNICIERDREKRERENTGTKKGGEENVLRRWERKEKNNDLKEEGGFFYN